MSEKHLAEDWLVSDWKDVSDIILCSVYCIMHAIFALKEVCKIKCTVCINNVLWSE